MKNILNTLKDYQVIPCHLVFDNSLTEGAKFLYIFIACKKEEWVFNFDLVVEETGYSIDALQRYMNELEERGWLVKAGQSLILNTASAIQNTTSQKEKEHTGICEEPSHGKEESIDWDAFLKFFNETMANRAIPPIERMTDKRKSNVKARMRENGKEALFRMIKKAAASNFLNGDSSRGFLANFDWLFRPTNFLKVLEGNYDNREHNEQNNNYGTNRQPSPTEETTFAAESAITKLLATNKPIE